MNSEEIIATIRRRRDVINDRSQGRTSAGMIEDADNDWLLVQEYHALLAEIQEENADSGSTTGKAATTTQGK